MTCSWYVFAFVMAIRLFGLDCIDIIIQNQVLDNNANSLSSVYLLNESKVKGLLTWWSLRENTRWTNPKLRAYRFSGRWSSICSL